MKRIGQLMEMVAAALVMFTALEVSAAGPWRPIPTELRAAIGATHCSEFRYTDFVGTTSNTVTLFTNSVPAHYAVTFVGMVLEKAFSCGYTNTDSLLLSIGDGSTTNLFLNETELASDGTEVFVSWAAANPYTVAMTYTVKTNYFMSAADTTNQIIYVDGTNSITAAVTATERGRKLYSSAGNVIFTFAHPETSYYAGTDLTDGVVRAYFKVFEAKTY